MCLEEMDRWGNLEIKLSTVWMHESRVRSGTGTWMRGIVMVGLQGTCTCLGGITRKDTPHTSHLTPTAYTRRCTVHIGAYTVRK